MLLLSSPSHSDCSVNRCWKHLPTVVRETRYFLGVDAPAHYFMGQIEQESGCNEGITSFDGGMGLGQLMPTTARELQAKYKELRELEFNPYDPHWNIRAMILYDRACYNSVDCRDWYFAFRAYNGGASVLNREIGKAGSCDWEQVEKCCRRRKVKLQSGQVLDLCKVNIEYPYRVFRNAKRYRGGVSWWREISTKTGSGSSSQR
jgi:hypothetical protein